MIKSKSVPFAENSESNQTNGIFSYLQEQTKFEDIDSKGVVSFTTNRRTVESIPLNLIDKNRSYWATSRDLDAYLLIDFKKNRVIVSDYTICNYGQSFAQEWKVHGSNNKATWKLISHETTNYASNEYNYHCFRYNSLSLERYRYIKITQQKGRTHTNGVHLVFYDLELYGIFYNQLDIPLITCFNRMKPRSFKSVLFYVILTFSS